MEFLRQKRKQELAKRNKKWLLKKSKANKKKNAKTPTLKRKKVSNGLDQINTGKLNEKQS